MSIARRRLAPGVAALVVAAAGLWPWLPGCLLEGDDGGPDHHGDDSADAYGLSVAGLTLSALDSRSGCTTAGTEGISRQLLDEMMCLSDGRLVRFSHANLHLASSRVHPYLSPEGRDMLLSVARSRDVTITSALRTIAE
ncbi:MAG: hypothetical protein IT379_00145, partial [Deltaproteobacteria bacterium]|nr:hypothetical protein [Deltaproteobacteria bacterium]